MNPSEDQIEDVLRHPPRPTPPPGLRARILDAMSLPHTTTSRPTTETPHKSWLRRWWPALASGGLAAAAFATVLVQQTQISRLERTIEDLTRGPAQPPPASAQPPPPLSPAGATVPQPDGVAELEALRARTRDMSDEVKALEAMQIENAQLKTQTLSNLGLPPEALEELAKAKERAQQIACVNNLKQLGLAARLWAVDNGDVLPPDLLCMSNEIAAPKILICPADTGHQPATDWGSFTPANTSYEFLAASGSETEPLRVAFRCPIHGNIGLVDGSVQMGVAKDHPDWLVPRDGKLMLEIPWAPEQPSAAPSGQTPQMDPRLLERYGLAPGGVATNQPAAVRPQGMSEEMMRRYGLMPAANDSDPK